MKKKYFTPEMEEFKYEIPTLMDEQEASVTGEDVCVSKTTTCTTDWEV